MKTKPVTPKKAPVVKKPAAKKIIKSKKIATEKTAVVFGLHNLKPHKGTHKPRKIKGRGPSSGHGKTSTRGSKGQTSRAGRHFYAGFEGGTSPLIRRMPKRGFHSRSKKEFQVVNLKDLLKIKEGIINPANLKINGLIRDAAKSVKILGSGEIKIPLSVQAHAFSKKAAQIITAAGGKTEIINPALSQGQGENK